MKKILLVIPALFMLSILIEGIDFLNEYYPIIVKAIQTYDSEKLGFHDHDWPSRYDFDSVTDDDLQFIQVIVLTLDWENQLELQKLVRAQGYDLDLSTKTFKRIKDNDRKTEDTVWK